MFKYDATLDYSILQNNTVSCCIILNETYYALAITYRVTIVSVSHDFLWMEDF